MTARIRVVVLNYNGGDLVHDAVASVAATRWPGPLEIVVVDNASTDGSPAAIAADFPDVRIVRSPRNSGFPANNLALADHDHFDYVALVNPDAFVEPGWLIPLVAILEREPQLGAACPLLLFAASHAVNNAGCELLVNGYARDRAMGVTDVGTLHATDVFAWSGGAVLLRAAYLRDVGLFAERFFLYYEDIDLSWRGRLRGWRYRFVPESIVHHHHSATVGTGSKTHQYYSERNRLLTLTRNAPAMMVLNAVVRFPLSTVSYLWTEAIRPMTRLRRPRLATVTVRTAAFGGFLRQLPAALRARRRIRRGATVSDQELFVEFVRDSRRRT